MFKHQTKTDKVILTTNGIFMTLIVLAILGPLLYVVMASFTDPNTLLSKGLSLNPSKWTFQGYLRVFKDGSILTGFRNSLFYSTAFSIISVTLTLFAAYPLARKDFFGRKVIMTIFIITMFFGGGLIPTYLLVKNLHMLDTIWAILIPGAVNVWNIILARAYFQGIPSEIREAAIVDGTSEIQYFFRILLPLSKPIIAVLVLYQFVGQWNSYFDAMIYLKSDNLQPLQIILRSILVQMQPRPGMMQDAQNTAQLQLITEMVKYSSIVISSLPLIIIYPFFQKYFEKGVMVGSIKG
ncbi:carbohydrate ABC transporter permease [Neobacillus ginsengisoli]|uniref:Aldouronate transport system permease protein n=1 Tax=Neobacillus ginsengisoli TaxID=904295 RepID=A0ABT9XY16_9BACI|nr:carbohydrate ABC transporter permease [Neobacillus ginsengisoli]MDQ0199814.1 putative aldouronate transport system permease protein [Neobacillus ginsengisoli]